MPINMYDPTRDYQSHKEEYNNAIQSVIDSGQFINGQQVKDLAISLATYTGAKYCIPCANGTDALYLSLLALDIKKGDEVITVAHTWISTSEVIALCGATPVFVDIDYTFNININRIEEMINKNTKAILVVSLYGLMPDYAKIKMIAEKTGIKVIEDGAQSFGAKRDDYKSCSCRYTDIATTSFFPSKPLGCYGDGGAVFTNNKELADKIQAIANHGGIERFKHKYIGMNSRLDTIQAAILNVKLKYLDKCLEKRNEVANKYYDKLNELKNIILPRIGNGCYHVWAQYSILMDSKDKRDKLVQHMKDNGVNVSIFYPKPLHHQECFAYLNKVVLPITEKVCDTVINLPCYAELEDDEQTKIINIFKAGM